MSAYSLTLYTSVLTPGGLRRVADLTETASGWRRSIRRQGGAWLGSFRFREQFSALMDFFYTQLGRHVSESVGSTVTWEGLIWEIDSPAQDEAGWFLDVQTAGYAHTLAWRNISQGDDAIGSASDWIAAILDHDAEFVAARRVTANSLQVKKVMNVDRWAWDELMRVTELGDGTGAPWRFHLEPGRTAVYEPQDTSVRYYTRRSVIAPRTNSASGPPPNSSTPRLVIWYRPRSPLQTKAASTCVGT